MADDPFEDPDVVAAADAPTQAPPTNVYGSDNAYDDVNIDVGVAKTAGTAVASEAAGRVKSDYNDSVRQQSDQHEQPPPPNFCVRLFNWVPIRLLAWLGGLGLVATPILDMLFGTAGFVGFFVYVYLIVFGMVTVFIEAPTWGCTRWVQLRLFFWFRIFARMWGRAWFYLFSAVLCFASLGGDNPGLFTIVCGCYLIVVSILSFLFSGMAARQFARIREYVAAGAENEELEGRFLRKFDALDSGGQAGRIGSDQLYALGKEAGRDMSNSERHAIQTFLDESRNGFVSKDDFMRQFVAQYAEKGFKQRFI